MADFNPFQKAMPVDEYLRICLAGPSTSGKTVSALRMATGMLRGTGKRIAIADTENKRSLKYSKFYDFDHLDFQPPFNSGRYLDYMIQAEKAGYGALIVDSASHEHEGPGGLLEQHEAYLQKRAGDDFRKREALKFSAWIEPKSQRNRLVQMGLQRVNLHLILCMRAKEKLAMIKDDKGKNVPTPIGWTPIGAEEFPYEMLSVMILPPKSAGKPDWNEPSATINSLDEELKALLHNVQQIDENFGAELVRLTRAADPATAALFAAGAVAAAKGLASYTEWGKALTDAQKGKIGTMQLRKWTAQATGVNSVNVSHETSAETTSPQTAATSTGSPPDCATCENTRLVDGKPCFICQKGAQ